MNANREDELRVRIGQMLAEDPPAQTEPVLENDRQFGELLVTLRALDPADLKGKLAVSGLVDEPYGDDRMRCQECMYYLVHRKWCDLPELAIPVEPDWWCRLWRI